MSEPSREPLEDVGYPQQQAIGQRTAQRPPERGVAQHGLHGVVYGASRPMACGCLREQRGERQRPASSVTGAAPSSRVINSMSSPSAWMRAS